MVQHQNVGCSDGAVGQREAHGGVCREGSVVHCDFTALLVQRHASGFARRLGDDTAFAGYITSFVGVEVGEVGVQLGVGQWAALAGAGDDGAHGRSPVLAV